MAVASDVSPDPYRYLEDAADPATIAWTAEQNARVRSELDGLPVRADLVARFDTLLKIDAVEAPVAAGDRLFYAARRSGAEQRVLYVREPGGQERTLVDASALDPSGLTALDWWYPSPAGHYVAFGLSRHGDERSTLGVLDVASAVRLSEAIPDTRYTSLAWLRDESAFFYTRYPPGGDYDVRVYHHTLGEAWQDDPLVFGEGRLPEEWMQLALSADGRRLTVSVSLGWSRNDLYLADLTESPLRFATLVEGRAARYEALPGTERLYVRSDEAAPRFRIFEATYAHPERAAWQELVPEDPVATLDGFALAPGALALHYLETARSRVELQPLAPGSARSAPALEGVGLLGLSASEDSKAIYVAASSFLAPPVVRRILPGPPVVDEVWLRVDASVDASAYRERREWVVSRDGTRVPLTILSRADLAQNGSAPAVLYGYGGFNVSLLPAFAPTVLPWLDAGGVYAIANLRGGGEFGEAWHRAGMRECKQNVFDDFIAAAQYLGSSGVADPARIGFMGGSNGGLLVAAAATQRPELARAVVCLVPLTDMLRFPEFLIARLWVAEYGDPAVPSDAEFLRAYSPYHNVRDGVAYPATYIATAESDSRVDPMHARKFAARLQAANGGPHPILVTVEADAGHGIGKPRHKQVAELADRWSFLFRELGVT